MQKGAHPVDFLGLQFGVLILRPKEEFLSVMPSGQRPGSRPTLSSMVYHITLATSGNSAPPPRLMARGQRLSTVRAVQDRDLIALLFNILPGLSALKPADCYLHAAVLARPSSVAFEATGLARPYQLATTRPASTLKFFIR